MKRMLVALSVLGIVCAATTAHAEYAEVRGLRMYYGVHGEGRPVVLLHGGGWGNCEDWKAQIPGLARAHRVIPIEQMGHGKDMRFTSITGYDPVEKSYFNYAFGSDGWRGTGSVTFGDGNVSTDWTGMTASGEKTRSRCTSDLSPEWTQKCERMTDGKWWVSSTGKSTKVK